MNKNFSQSGFSIIELLLAISIGVVVVAMVTTITAIGLKNVQASRRIEQMHSDSIYITDTLAYFAKQAKYISVPSSTNLVLTLQDSTTKTFTISSGKITLDGTPINNQNVTASNLNFTKQGRSVRVTFSLAAAGSTQTTNVATTISQRNQ